MVKDQSAGARIAGFAIHFVLLAAALVCIVPFFYIFFGSFTSQEELIRNGGFVLFPSEFSLEAYRYILRSPSLFRSFWIAVMVTVTATGLSIFLTSMSAYVLSRPGLPGRRLFMAMVVFPMIFSGGMVPTFLTVRMLGLLDSYWALILPGAILSFNLIVMRNFFQSIPNDFHEAATIDGCNDLGIFFRIILPLSKASTATITLLYAVTNWNSYLPAILYINDTAKWPLQVWLRQVVILSLGNNVIVNTGEGTTPPMQSIKFAVIIIVVIPILIVYPFIQRHFTQGMMMGSIKG